MGDIKRMNYYTCYKIFEQIYESPTVKNYEIGNKAKICRNIIPRYLKTMYAQGIVRGPFLFMKATPEYKEYVYLMNFQDPLFAFERLKAFPHVVYTGMTSGDWNVIVVTDRLLDLSRLEGAEHVGFKGFVDYRETPKVQYIRWENSFEKIDQEIESFSPVQKEPRICNVTPSLYWEKDEWTLYHIFKYDMRKKTTALLRKNGIRYDTFTKWKNELVKYCTVHTEFYPKGYDEYLRYSFLFSTDYPEKVKSVFSFFPATPIFMELDNHLFTILSLESFGCIKKLFRSIFAMKAKNIINGYRTAIVINHERM